MCYAQNEEEFNSRGNGDSTILVLLMLVIVSKLWLFRYNFPVIVGESFKPASND
jgi:hypothetical protein